MKIGIVRLYVGNSGKVGYYNIQELGLAKALLKRGIKTDIFYLNKSENKNVIIQNISEGIRIIYIPALKIGNHGIVNPSFILKYSLDIVHLLSDNQVMVPTFIRFCKKNNIPVYNYVGTIYSDTNNKIKKIIANFISNRNIRCFKKSITIAKTMEIKKILESTGIEKVKLIPVGLDFDIIPDIKESKVELRKKLKLPMNKNILIFVGRLEAYKNPLQAIEIMRELNQKSVKYYLVIIGAGSMKSDIIMMINKYNLANNIQIVDKIENIKIHSYYRACDIFINLNNKEIFGMSVLEAMYQECKVMAIEAPGPSFIINDKLDGIIMRNMNYKSWINEIEKLESDKEIGKLARKKVENLFDWSNIAKQYIELSLYKNILSGK